MFVIGLLGAWLAVLMPADSLSVEEVIRNAVADHARECGETVTIENLRLPSVLRSKSGIVCSVAIPSAKRLRGPSTLMVEVREAGGGSRVVPVSMTIRTFGTVLLAGQKFERYSPFEEGTVTSGIMETTRLPDGYLTDPSAVRGRRTTRIISSGTVLYPSLCEKIPEIRQGDEVLLVSRQNGVVLKTPAVAKQDGVAGSVIVVQPSGTHQRLRSVVVDARTVELRVQ